MVWMRRAVLLCLLAFFSWGAAGEDLPLIRFSLPPVLEALPIAFAQEWGLFEEHGVEVELIGITDNQQRSAALLTGNLDGLMQDVTGAVLDASVSPGLAIVAAASSRPQTGSLALAVLSPTSFRVETLAQLCTSSQLIGILFRSDYEYMLDRLFEAEFGPGACSALTSPFSDMLQLATMFGAQWLGAAVLPEPYISYIATYEPPGGSPVEMRTLAAFDPADVPPSVVVFQASYVEDHPEAVAAFLAAIDEAIERLNGIPRDELVDQGLDIAVSLFFQAANTSLIGEDVLDALPIPVFLPHGILDEARYDDIVAWMHENGYVYNSPAYADLVRTDFLP